MKWRQWISLPPKSIFSYLQAKLCWTTYSDFKCGKDFVFLEPFVGKQCQVRLEGLCYVGDIGLLHLWQPLDPKGQ